MLEAIALKLITTLTGFLFEGYLDTLSYSKIEGAPSWYGSSGSARLLHGYGYSKGGIEYIDVAKANCRADLQDKIQQSIEIIIYENFRDITHPIERELIAEVQNDPQLHIFVNRATKFERVEHQKEREKSFFRDANIAQTFAGCIIPKDEIIAYQTERITRLQKEISLQRSQEALDSLDAYFQDDYEDDFF